MLDCTDQIARWEEFREKEKKNYIYFFFFKKDRSLSPFLSEQIFYFPSKKKNNM